MTTYKRKAKPAQGLKKDGSPQTDPPAGPPIGPDDEVVFRSLAGLKAKPVKYAVPKRLPWGKVVLIAGDGGAGKSTLFRHIAAALSAGKAVMGGDYKPPPPCKVVMLAAEDSYEEVVVPSLIAEGANMQNVLHLDSVKTMKNGKESRVQFRPEHLESLQRKLAENPDVKCIVIDPVASYAGRAKIDAYKDTELRQVLDPLCELADSTGILILVLAHVNKASAAKAVYRIAGSTAYVTSVRLAYILGEDPDDADRRLMVAVKKNLLGVADDAVAFRLHRLDRAEVMALRTRREFADLSDDDYAEVAVQMARLEFDAPVQADADRMMGAGQKGRDKDPNKVERCAEWLAEFLKEFAFPSDEILDSAKAAGFTFDNVKEAKARLKETSGLRHKLHGFGSSGRWWSGFGDPNAWSLRPEPSATTPRSPRSPRSPFSPLSPLSGETSGNLQCGETGERRECRECRECRGPCGVIGDAIVADLDN